MLESFKMMLIIGAIGGISSGIGGLLGGVFNIKKQGTISVLFNITAGLMTGIVCFDILPESFHMSSLLYSLIGIILGIVSVYLLDYFVNRLNSKKLVSKKTIKYSLMSLVVMLSMGFHNVVEGLAIGTGMMYSTALGSSILISIFLHDIPEGMVVAAVNKADNLKFIKVLINSIVVGSYAGIGAGIGSLIGKISNEYIAVSLAFSAGAMLYIVACELIPNANKGKGNRKIALMYIVGILIGALISKI